MIRRASLLLALAASACATGRGGDQTYAPPPPPRLDVDAIAAAIPEKAKDRRGWAGDIVAALDAHGVTPAPVPVCEVVAVIEQESGFSANPVVANLSGIVKKKLDDVAGRAGPVGRPILESLLSDKAPGATKTFLQRVDGLKTEKDLDVWFRELLAVYQEKHPNAYRAADLMGEAFAGRGFADLNPITTAGSMQVSVRFAEQLGARHGTTPDEVRDALYTRRGGVYYGAARLLLYQAAYEDPVYRFADYNAGYYASRNAAVQEQLAELLGVPLAPDGDLLAYDEADEPRDVDTNTLKALLEFRARFAPELSERTVRKDARAEKTLDFESTATWKALKRVYQARLGKAPRYARVPDVTLVSPKLSKDRSTRWFAESVDRRFDACMKKLGQRTST
jgi:hypothetical protein